MGPTDEPNKQGPARGAEATTNDDENQAEEELALIEDNVEVEETTTKKAVTEPRAVPEPSDQVSKLSPQVEPSGMSLESSSLVDEQAEESQHLQQPQQGSADDRDDLSNKEISQEEKETPKQRPLIGRAQGEAPLWDSKGSKQLSSRPFKVVFSQRFHFNGYTFELGKTTLEGSMWIAQGRSYSGLAVRQLRPTKPPDNLPLQSRL